MTIKERELQKLYEMFLPKPFVKDSCFITFVALRVKHYCLTLRGYNCASYEKRCQSRGLGKALDSLPTFLSMKYIAAGTASLVWSIMDLQVYWLG